MKSILKLSSLSIAFLTLSAFAGGPEVPMNQTGLFLGVGGSYNSVDKLATVSIDNDSGVDLSKGINTFAPFVQLGYFGELSNSIILGVKSWYKYLDANMVVYWEPIDKRFLDQTQVPHEFSMMGMLGYMFSNSYMYLGGGSVLFDVINTMQDYDTGSSSSNSKVMWGGAGQIGWAYYASPTWVLDMAYTYAISAEYDFHKTVGAHTVNANDVQIRSQEFVASINKIFAL